MVNQIAGVLPETKRYFEDNSDGLGRRVPMEELKALTEQDREDMKQNLVAIGYTLDSSGDLTPPQSPKLHSYGG